MRQLKFVLAALVLASLVTSGAFAGTNLNEVGAFLVYPLILANSDGELANVETFVTITNALGDDLVAHLAFINGNENSSDYCNECNLPLPLTGNDTETLVIRRQGNSTFIEAEDLGIAVTCPWTRGMLVVAIENEDGVTLTDNVLLGEEVVVNYAEGSAVSIPAIPFQGKTGDGDRVYSFDDSEYGLFPRIVAADYLAPSIFDRQDGSWAMLYLFTLGFERNFEPRVDCSVIGWDAHEHFVSASFQFGCWTSKNLCAISPEYCWPNLGLFNDHPTNPRDDTHGWLQLNCRVDHDYDGDFDADGGVHGAIVQQQYEGSHLPAPDRPDFGEDGEAREFGSTATWGRLLYQSVTTGDPVSLILVPAADDGGGLGEP